MRIGKQGNRCLDWLTIYLVLLFFMGFYFREFMTTPGVILVGGLLMLRLQKVKTINKNTCYVFLFMVMNVVFTELVCGIFTGMGLQVELTVITIINMVLGLLLAVEIGTERFRRTFVSCMIVLSVASLIAFGMQILWPDLLTPFPILVNTQGWKSRFLLFTMVSNFSQTGSHRNLGIFWEPGTYQIFLSLAYMCEFSVKKRTPRKRVLALFLVTMVSTMSTVGLLVAALLFCVTVCRKDGKLNGKKVLIVVGSMVAAVAVTFPFLPPYLRYALVDKIVDVFEYIAVGTASHTVFTRVDSVTYPLRAFVTSPLWGVGIAGYQKIKQDFNVLLFTCTPINWIAQYGIVYAAAIYYGLWKFFKKAFNSNLDAGVFIGIFLLSVATEAVQRDAIFFAIAFMGYLNDEPILRKRTNEKTIVGINSGVIGSTGNIMLGIAKLAREAGYVYYTACPDARSMRQKKLDDHIYIGTSVSRNIHSLLGKLTGFHGVFSIVDTWLFLNDLDQIKPDVIHLHNLHDCYINLPMLFGYIKRKKIRTVWTLHDCWSFTGQCPHFEMAGCGRWEHGCKQCSLYRNYPSSYLDQSKTMWTLKKKWFTQVENLTIITPSQWLADLVNRSFLGQYPVQVIHNGINLEMFVPRESNLKQKLGCEDKHMLVGVAFGWGKRKGLDVFLELAKRLGDVYQIVLVGTNDEVDRQLPENIISIHRTSNQQELAEIYTAADLFVNPTREEVLGLVNIEANACGTPVLTFRTGGSPECINEFSGRVVDKDDVDAMEREIRFICMNAPFTKQDCMENAKRFDGNKKFREYVDCYERIIHG